MERFICLILLGVLTFAPGSTLNAIESEALTPTKTVASKPILTTSTTVEATALNSLPAVRRKTWRRNTTSHENSTRASPTPPNSHSMNQSFVRITAGTVALEAEEKAKSSITASKKDGVEAVKTAEVTTAVGDYKFAAEFSTIQITKATAWPTQAESAEAKTKTAAAAETLSGSSTQSTAKVDVTTKRTKASLSRTVTVDKENDRRVAGESGWNGGSLVDSMVAKSTTTVTPTAKATTIGGSATTASEATTIESLSAAAAAQLVATLFPITMISDEFSLKNYQNSAVGAFVHNQQTSNNDHYNYNYNYNYDSNKLWPEAQKGDSNNNSALSTDFERITSSHPQRTHPLQRPEIRKTDDGDGKRSNNYYNNSNNNYVNSQQSAVGSTLLSQQPQPLRQLRQQYARQFQQQPFYLATLMISATSPTPAAVEQVIDDNLIGTDIPSKQDATHANKSTARNHKMDAHKTGLESAPSSGSTTLTTEAAAKAELDAGVAGAVASVERTAMNITTSASAFPTVTTIIVKSTTRRPPPTTTPRPTPSIDDYQTVISQAGTHAYLPCNVKQLLKKPISWLRVRDGHILTVDQTTFIADQRFQSIYAPSPERWSLQIKYVQLKDEGTYECQVSTEPKSSAIVSLRVVEPRTELIGEPTRHVNAGSQVKLRCIISQALEPPLFINWFHNQKQIYLHSRRGWRTEIERIELPITDAPTTTSIITTTQIANTTVTSPTITVQADGATTMTASTPTTAGAAPITTINSESSDFDSYSNIGNAGIDTSTVQATLAAIPNGLAMAVATTMPLASVPPSTLATDAVASTMGVSSSGFAFGTGNTTSSLLAAMTATASAMSTTQPTITETIHWPKATTTVTTASTTLAAVEVRQITTASLIIASVEKQDSGNYTCSPSNSAPKTVVLHVLNGEYSASAITSGVRANDIVGKHCEWLGALLLLILQQHHHKIAAILSLLRNLAFVFLLFIWPRTEPGEHTEAANATAKVLNAAAPVLEICSLCRGQALIRVLLHRQLTGVWDHAGNKGELATGDVASTARQTDNASNCGDDIWNIHWQFGSTLRMLTTKEKT